MNDHLLTQRCLKAETRARLAEESYTKLWRLTVFSNIFWIILLLIVLYPTKG